MPSIFSGPPETQETPYCLHGVCPRITFMGENHLPDTHSRESLQPAFLLPICVEFADSQQMVAGTAVVTPGKANLRLELTCPTPC